MFILPIFGTFVRSIGAECFLDSTKNSISYFLHFVNKYSQYVYRNKKFYLNFDKKVLTKIFDKIGKNGYDVGV